MKIKNLFVKNKKENDFLILSSLHRTFKNDYLFKNCMIPGNDKEKIDFMLLDRKGLFVFSYFNVTGEVFGSNVKEKWTVINGEHGYIVKEDFANPLIEDNRKIKIILDYLLMDIPVYSYVLFNSNANINSIVFEKSERVLLSKELIPYLKKDLAHLNNVLSNEEMNRINEKLEPLCYKY